MSKQAERLNPDPKSGPALPLKRSLMPVYILSSIITALMTGVSIAGILQSEALYQTPELLQSLLPSDAAMLIVGVPALICAMWLTHRNNLTGLLLWPGAVFIVLYNYLVYVLVLPLSGIFCLHLTLVTFSIYTLVWLLTCLDSAAIQRIISRNVPERLAGGVLAGLGLLFFLRAVFIFIQSIVAPTALPDVELSTLIADFLITPSWIVCGILLLRRKTFGYVSGLGLLFQASMLFIGLIILLLLLPVITDGPLRLMDVLVTAAMGLICFIPFALFVRGACKSSR